jgi:exosome complex RNA-binding protein Rrp42 (RNase PH superfamily)
VDIDDVVNRLEAISEELADAAIQALMEANSRGDGRRPETERNLTIARRSIEKAITTLRRVDSGD